MAIGIASFVSVIVTLSTRRMALVIRSINGGSFSRISIATPPSIYSFLSAAVRFWRFLDADGIIL